MKVLGSVCDRQRVRGAVLAVLALLVVIPVAAVTGATAANAVTACSTSWKSPGTSGSFTLAKNWTNGVPTATTDACLPASATPYTVSVHASAQARGLVIGTGTTLDMESTPANAASMSIGIGGIASSGTITLANTDPVSGANVLSVDPAATLENDGLVQILATGTVAQEMDATVANTANGTLDAASDTTVTGIDNSGFVTVEAPAHLTTTSLGNYDAATQTLSGGQFTVSGQLLVPGADVKTLDAEISLSGSGALLDSNTNANGLRDLATVTANGAFLIDGGGNLLVGVLTNHGRVSIGAGSSLASAGSYTQAGVYTSLAPGSQLFTTNGGKVMVTAGDIVGAGTIESSVVNSGGVMFPAGQISIAGSYTQQKNGTLSVRVGGSGGSGNLSVTSYASFNGTLDVTADGALVPQRGMSFDVLDSSSSFGAFRTIASHGLAVPYEFAVGYSATSASAVILADYNDNHPNVQYQGWHGGFDSAATGGTFHETCTPGDTATFTFSGSSLVWNTAHGTFMGDADVSIDGVSKGTFDLYSPTTAAIAQKFTKLGAGTHTFVMTVLATKNALSTDTCIAVDRLKAGTKVTEDTDRSIGWSRWTGVTAGSDGYRTANVAGTTVTIAADMTGVEWVTRMGPNQGTATISVDGVVVQTVNLYSATPHTLVREFAPTADGFHTVTITVLGVKDPASTGTNVTIDAFIAH